MERKSNKQQRNNKNFPKVEVAIESVPFAINK